MRTLAFINLKGGTGKTVSAANVAHIMAALHRKKVLLVDGDKQGNASRYFRRYGEQDGTAELLMLGPELMNIAAAIYQTEYKGLDIITSNMELYKTDRMLYDSERETARVLASALERVRNDYDFCIIDNGPAVDMVTLNVLAAADDVLIPIRPDEFSFSGLLDLVEQVQAVQESVNPGLTLRGAFFTHWQNREPFVLARQSLEDSGRRLASLQLVKQGKEAYRKMPCMVEDGEREPGPEADELRAIDEAILLITTNGQREKTDWDKVQEATRLRALLDRKRRFEKIPGETRKLIAEQLGTTPAQVGRYDSIEKHLIPAFKGWLEEGKIGISVAYELSTLPEDVQENAAEECRETRAPVTLEDVRRWKRDAEPWTPPAGAEQETTGAAEEVPPPPLPPTENEGVRTEPTKPTPMPPDGKIVDFPAPSSPPPAEDTPRPEKEPMHKRMAANILEDLQMYCEEMLGIEAGLADTWAERADALAVAIAALRR